MVTAVKRSVRVVTPVPRLWPTGTLACIATGPSLTQADVDAVRGKVDAVIVVNDAYRLAPWADVLYACDAKWWHWHPDAVHFTGLKYAVSTSVHRVSWNGPAAVQVLRNSGRDGLDRDPTALKTGHNSGFQAINLAVHFGARRILLLGYDMQGTHFFGAHPDGSKPPFTLCLQKFDTLVAPLRSAGVEVVNCTRATALRCFPQRSLQEALCLVSC